MKSLIFLFIFFPFSGFTVFAQNDTNCGKRKINLPIKKNTFFDAMDVSKAHLFPWTASIGLIKNKNKNDLKPYYTNWCTASVIHPQWLLTSASCERVVKQNLKAYAVLAAYNISSEAVTGNDSRKITIEIEKIIVHSEYSDSNAFINNIALVKLVAPVDVAGNPDLNTICVPTLRAHKIKKYGQRRVIPVNVAWEPNEKNDAKSELLQELGSTIVPNKDCMKKYNIDLKYKHQLYCMNACLGYDGGAVEFINHQPSDDKYPWTLLGIAFPKGSNPDNSCCVYTSVEYYSDWIWKTIQQNI